MDATQPFTFITNDGATHIGIRSADPKCKSNLDGE